MSVGPAGSSSGLGQPATAGGLQIALFKDATEIVWQVADHLARQGQGVPAPQRRFVKDADEVHQLILDGTVPVTGMSLDDVLDSSRSGHHRAGEVTAFYGVHRGFLSLLARSPVADLAALRCRRVAVDTFSGYASALFEILERAGLDYQTDLQVVLAGATNLRYEKLFRAEFEATLLGTPFDLLAESRGLLSLARVLTSLGGYQGVVFAAQRSWLDGNQGLARSLTQIFEQALSWASARANRPAVREIIRASQPATETVETNVLEAIADCLFGANSEFCPQGAIRRSDADEVVRLFAKYRQVDLSNLELPGIVDTRFCDLT